MNKRTCDNPTHEEIERIHMECGQALFQLKEWIKQAQLACPNDAIPIEVDPSSIVDEAKQDFHIDSQGQVIVGDDPQSASKA